jgi:glycosyltransferase involved in cell wall biosynthesis
MKIIYIGGFEMPDKNAAAQRVLSVAKALRMGGHEVKFYGITKCNDFSGAINGFEYEACKYPAGLKDWIFYASGKDIVSYLKQENPQCIITYNYPAIAQERVIRYCRKNGIKVIGDITEWYNPKSFIKHIDSTLRMRCSNKHLDGIIAISKYLSDYYTKQNVLQLPPLTDVEEDKWKNQNSINPQQNPSNPTKSTISLIYVGSPGGGKDCLDYILMGMKKIQKSNLSLDIVGITKEQYLSLYDFHDIEDMPVKFHGRLPHSQAVNLLKQSDFQIFFRENIRSNNAGFPTKFAEAMTAGIPVIANRISNIANYVEYGKNGYLIDSPSQSEIQSVLEEISKLSRVDLDRIKGNCDKSLFDYRSYASDINRFISSL